MYCENCGGQMADGSKFCVACGAKTETKEPVQEVAVQEAAASVESTAAAIPEMAKAVIPPAAPQPVQVQKAQPIAPPAPVQQVYTQPAPAQQVYTQPQQTQPAQPQQQAVPAPVKIRKPASTTPLPVWKYVGIFLLMSIPILNIIMILVWSFGDSCNLNTKNYAKAVLVMFIIFVVLTIVSYFTIWNELSTLISGYNITL